MSKRTFKEIRKALLSVLEDGKPHSLGELERKIRTNWKTVRNHCDDLLIFDAITKKNFEKHDQNGRPYIEITITKIGLELLKKL